MSEYEKTVVNGLKKIIEQNELLQEDLKISIKITMLFSSIQIGLILLLGFSILF